MWEERSGLNYFVLCVNFLFQLFHFLICQVSPDITINFILSNSLLRWFKSFLLLASFRPFSHESYLTFDEIQNLVLTNLLICGETSIDEISMVANEADEHDCNDAAKEHYH